MSEELRAALAAIVATTHDPTPEARGYWQVAPGQGEAFVKAIAAARAVLASPPPDDGLRRALLRAKKYPSSLHSPRCNGSGWFERGDKTCDCDGSEAFRAALSATPSAQPEGLTEPPECLCEGEFVWACGPECSCWHHGRLCRARAGDGDECGLPYKHTEPHHPRALLASPEPEEGA